MTPIPNLNMIILGAPTSALREGVQELVTQHTTDWWHQLPDVWIVAGGSPAEWRDRIRPLKIAAGEHGTVLVLRLPEPGAGRSWASSGSDNDSVTEWLYENYTGGWSKKSPNAISARE